MYTLCVIDMQPKFNVHHHSRVVNNAEREVRQAIKDDAHIVFVEYYNCGDTVDQLTSIAKQHSKVYRVEKIGDNGTLEMVDAIRNHKLPTRHIKVCGVNTDICVYFTVHGLHGRLPNSNIEIIADACDSQWGASSHLYGLESLKKIGCTISHQE